MLVVEFEFETPILMEALSQAPETRARYEDQYETSEGITFLFWAEGGDPAAFETGLEADATVTNAVELAESRDRRLYKVTFTDHGNTVATFPSWRELHATVLESTGTVDGWEIRMRIPDREALRAYRDACLENGLGFELLAVYEQNETATLVESHLTDAQRETLRVACDLGYFEVPRRASLSDVAEQSDISTQAASERIRRATANLVDVTLWDA